LDFGWLNRVLYSSYIKLNIDLNMWVMVFSKIRLLQSSFLLVRLKIYLLQSIVDSISKSFQKKDLSSEIKKVGFEN
jgi:hypothetical protein